MYKIKQLPEDFVVKEIPLADRKPEGKYLYFLMKKKGRNTLDVIQELARRLHLREKDIGFAGSKDRHAVTEQMISIIGAKKEIIENLKVRDVSLEFQGLGKVPVSLGDLQENEFEIVVRNLEGQKISRVDFLENYFGEQRFSLHNAGIGKHIIKKNSGRQ